MQLDRRCGSGLQAVIQAVFQVQSGANDVVIAGGAESMSNAAFYSTDMRWGAARTGITMHDRHAIIRCRCVGVRQAHSRSHEHQPGWPTHRSNPVLRIRGRMCAPPGSCSCCGSVPITDVRSGLLKMLGGADLTAVALRRANRLPQHRTTPSGLLSLSNTCGPLGVSVVRSLASTLIRVRGSRSPQLAVSPGSLTVITQVLRRSAGGDRRGIGLSG
jgi:hypothetical protein